MSDTLKGFRERSYGNSRYRLAGLKKYMSIKRVSVGFNNLKRIKLESR